MINTSGYPTVDLINLVYGSVAGGEIGMIGNINVSGNLNLSITVMDAHCDGPTQFMTWSNNNLPLSGVCSGIPISINHTAGDFINGSGMFH